MLLKTLFPLLYLAPEDGGAGSGGTGEGVTQSSSGKQTSSQAGSSSSQTAGSQGTQSGQQQDNSGSQELSWRTKAAEHLDEGDRDAWGNWSGRYTDDKAFVRGVNDLRKNAARHQPLPDDKTPAEARHNFFKALGKPDTAEAYTLKDEGYGDAEKALLGEFKNFAHTQHLTQGQAEALKTWHDAQMKASIDQNVARIKTARADNQAALKQMWGADYDANINFAEQARDFIFKSADEREAWDKFRNEQVTADGSVGGNHPIILRMMAHVGRMIAEDPVIGRANNPAAAADIDAQIKSITDEALSSGKDPTKEPYHSKLQALYSKKHGNKPLNFRQW